jgi:hypothetical protein
VPDLPRAELPVLRANDQEPLHREQRADRAGDGQLRGPGPEFEPEDAAEDDRDQGDPRDGDADPLAVGGEVAAEHEAQSQDASGESGDELTVPSSPGAGLRIADSTWYTLVTIEGGESATPSGVDGGPPHDNMW